MFVIVFGRVAFFDQLAGQFVSLLVILSYS